MVGTIYNSNNNRRNYHLFSMFAWQYLGIICFKHSFQELNNNNIGNVLTKKYFFLGYLIPKLPLAKLNIKPPIFRRLNAFTITLMLSLTRRQATYQVCLQSWSLNGCSR